MTNHKKKGGDRIDHVYIINRTNVNQCHPLCLNLLEGLLLNKPVYVKKDAQRLSMMIMHIGRTSKFFRREEFQEDKCQ